MVLYSIIMFLTAIPMIIISVAIYRGNTDLIHDYHQTKVTVKLPMERLLEKLCSLSPWHYCSAA